MMAEIANRLRSIPALILEHSYIYESFGSWWFTFKRSGKKFRVVFDGRDNFLSLDRSNVVDGSRLVAEWQSVDGKRLPDQSSDSLILEVCTLVEAIDGRASVQ